MASCCCGHGTVLVTDDGFDEVSKNGWTESIESITYADTSTFSDWLASSGNLNKRSRAQQRRNRCVEDIEL